MFRIRNSIRGVTLIDTLIGVALMVVVFVGIYGVFILSIDVVTNNKSRIGALALANESMEYLRSLPYDSIGTEGGIPSGSISQSEDVSLNNVAYSRRVLVLYLDKAADGLGGLDENSIIADVKQAKISVSWVNHGQTRTIVLVSEFAPPGIESNIPGGTISVEVVDAASTPLSGASVRIVNSTTNPAIDVTSSSDINGVVTFIGAPASSGYQITVSRLGYSTAQTYSATPELTNPSPGHLTVSEGQTTVTTLAIDVVGTFAINTFRQIYPETWADSFANESKISTSTAIVVSGGAAQLEDGELSGSVTSVSIEPAFVSNWTSASWDDATSTGNIISYHIYSGTNIVPDSVLSGNAAGFTKSPIDLTGVATSSYPLLVLKADLAGDGSGGTPVLNSWKLDYDEGPEPLSSIQYTLTGSKTVGINGSGDPVYKYDAAGSSGASASVTLVDMEWDVYALSVPASSGYDVAESCLPQPNTLTPGQNLVTNLYLDTHTTNSLIVDIRASDGTPIQNATVEISRAVFNASNVTASCGQVFFPGLSVGTIALENPYSITITASGYIPYAASDVEASGASTYSVVLTQ